MPATEKTWRDQKLLHVVFGITGVILLVSTIWMFAADHNRQWKVYQRISRSIEQRLASWRLLGQEIGEQARVVDELKADYAAAESTPPHAEILEQFKVAAADSARFDDVDAMYAKLTETGQLAEKLRADIQRLQAAAQQAEQKLQDPQQNLETARQSLQAASDADREAAQQTVAQAQRLVEESQNALASQRADLASATDELRATEPEAQRMRTRLFSALSAVVRDARFREDAALTQRKFEAAEYDAQGACTLPVFLELV
jgi:DNA repair exonuclease SbcCD ATPase subunit